jgi:peptide/nickel transport system permease protein
MERQKNKSINLFWKKFKQDTLAVIGLGIIILFCLIALLGPCIRPDSSPNANLQNLSIAQLPPLSNIDVTFCSTDGVFHTESKTFILGTDRLGRDILSRLMAGTYISLLVGWIAVCMSLIIGLTLGVIAGYYRGWIDHVLSWIINVFWSIPGLLVVMAFILAFGTGFWKVFIAVGLTMWVEVARVARGQVLSIREKEYIEAARSIGASDFSIMYRHILPNIMPPIIVISAANFASAILIESGLSFLGLGTQIPAPSWGNMIRENYSMITTSQAYLAIAPGLLIMITVLSLMYIGNGLRHALDVKSS